MKPFDYIRLDGAFDPTVTASATDDMMVLAGGTDLVPSLKVGLVTPNRLVDVKGADLPAGVEVDGDGVRIGALTTLAELEDSSLVAERLTVIGDAVSQAATRQIRNRATVGGNLLQRSRCAYYRDPDLDCWLAGGDDCPARSGLNQHHAVVDTGPCVTTHPSDLAAALVALDASVELHGPDGDRTVAVADLLAPPTEDRRRLHTLGDGELIWSVTIPELPAGPSCSVKAMDRAAWQFALVGVAAVAFDDRVALVASGIAATPWRLRASEEALARSIDDAVEDAVAAATDGLEPLSDNGYKLRLLRGLVRRALSRIAAPGSGG